MYRVFAAAALASASWAAMAADVQRSPLPALTAPRAVATYNWSGPYTGINLGYLWGTVDNLGLAPRGAAGGAQAGYNWQTGPVVFGGEADIQASGAQDTFAPYQFVNPWFGTVRGRSGYAFENLLVYATAGLAYGGGRLQIAGLSESKTHLGWTAGGGIEVGLTPTWSAKAEYLFIGLSDKTYVLSGISNGIDAHLVRFGVNRRF
jgi:outer membrane immunogenic protein